MTSPSPVDTALDQLSEIHAQLMRTAVFRGYRSRPMAATALLAAAAATLQASFLPHGDGVSFARYWAALAVLCVAICGTDLVLGSRLHDSASERARTLRVVGQLAPAFAAGIALPFVLLRANVDAVHLLPGMWTLVFGLAVFASRPFLPRAVGYVGAWYCGAGIVSLALAEPGVPSAWSMGVPFGVGQALSALVLHFGLERQREVD